ncbi:MAG: murein transglycosylase A [Rhodoblastus sp.]
MRPGVRPSAEMIELDRRAQALGNDPTGISEFFLENFIPYEVLGASGQATGFVTGYYEPEVDASETPSPEFSAPVLARPNDLIDMRGAETRGWDKRLEGARMSADGQLSPYPTRVEIENGALGDLARPVAWLRDHVEVFFCQVQGSARLRLQNGRSKRLVYAGRNGRPYTSIGRLLISQGEIPADEISRARCKQWLRENGLEPSDRGRAILQSNDSYIFFRLEDDLESGRGPTGAQGIALTPMRSIAVDRNVWPYGTPVWIGADLTSAGLGTGPMGQLMIAQDTGSAIVGPARGDLFIGSGDRAGDIAGLIRHSARFVVFAPRGFVPHDRS